MARLLLGVSGGIAAYKALETARAAIKAGHVVRVIQTPASEQFVGRAAFAAITGAPVLGDEFEPDPARGAYPGEPVPDHAPISHLVLVARADVYLIAPASANTIAKLAHGLADNLLTAAALAAPCPVAIAPAMNNHMYANPATQANLEQLRARGITVIGPDTGELASHGERGIGRLAEPPVLLEACEALLTAPTLAGRHVLVSAGGTREPIDSVRYIGNRSSGRMGTELAAAAVRRGAQVTLVAANVSLPIPAGVDVVRVNTAAELGQACEERFDACDVLVMAAAVADFRPATPADYKLKKTGAATPTSIELERTDDILSALAARRRAGQVLVGFAAEHGDGAIQYGREKLARKRLDAVVVNDISRPEIGFDSAENAVTILSSDGAELTVAQTSKRRVAEAVLDVVSSLQNDLSRVDGDGAAGPNPRSTERV
ncbi:MAG TPA: bifunctional phosphopantothenoylcysteine decarboxylase/phosphopantothenate--cysteine ligase CoaBC [Solirubrobacteraceae bacterium]|nr:bifunctional phosphopantothenoylcysteine decarboxylase/phosphopantothenate--cysteine ligase CoaBC [Solirubrobacteraceae bacterium]